MIQPTVQAGEAMSYASVVFNWEAFICPDGSCMPFCCRTPDKRKEAGRPVCCLQDSFDDGQGASACDVGLEALRPMYLMHMATDDWPPEAL